MNVPLTPVRFLYRAIDLFKDDIGVVSGESQFTYGEFGARCLRLASALMREGIKSGDRIAYLSFNNHQLVESYFGVPLAHAVCMPLNVRLSPVELVNIVNHSGATILMYEPEFETLVEQLRSVCPAVKRFITLDEAYEAFLDTGQEGRIDFMGIDENAPAELFYTSGSTGTPKGVVLSHRTLYLHALNAVSCYTNTDTMVSLATIPLFHANGWGQVHTCTMLGVKQVMVRRFDPALVCGLIQEHGATDLAAVPTMANALINFPGLGKYDLTSLREIKMGGAASSPDLIRRVESALGCRCISGYGLTETAPLISMSRARRIPGIDSEEERYRRQAMAGWPTPGIEISVVDSGMNAVPQDMQSIGEVVARGDQIMSGYYRDPEATAAVMTGAWFHTGDMAVWDEFGYIHIVDRKKEIIISGGENISSIEVEKAIFAHPAVFECAVVAAPDEKWGEVPVAIVVKKPDHAVTEQELLDFVGARLGRFKVPRKIEITEEPLPKTGTGKIRKMLLREKYWEGMEKRVHG